MPPRCSWGLRLHQQIGSLSLLRDRASPPLHGDIARTTAVGWSIREATETLTSRLKVGSRILTTHHSSQLVLQVFTLPTAPYNIHLVSQLNVS